MESVDSTISKVYTWGMDLSGSMQGAGGVGGLLSVTEISSDPNATHDSVSYYPTYDGNGNISEYLEGSAGASPANNNVTVVAHYEYDSFGNTTVATGSKVNDFAHKFSTKQLENETGFYYYGYRYYNPVTGTWPNRDPIEEKGGDNIYLMINNAPLNFYDYLGLSAANCNAAIANYKTNNQKRLSELSNIKCPISFKCEYSEDSTTGKFFPKFNLLLKPRGGKVTVYYCDKNKSQDRYLTTINHEMVHAEQHCSGKIIKNCEDAVIAEIEAYCKANCSKITSASHKRTCVFGGAKDSTSDRCSASEFGKYFTKHYSKICK